MIVKYDCYAQGHHKTLNYWVQVAKVRLQYLIFVHNIIGILIAQFKQKQQQHQLQTTTKIAFMNGSQVVIVFN